MGEYGAECHAFVLANTLQKLPWDGRFSRDNKAWAAEFHIPEDMVHGMDMNRELIVTSHPAVLDGFINVFRREVLEREKEADNAIQKESQEVETDTLGQHEQKPETEDIDDGDEIIDLGDEVEQVLADMKKYLENNGDTLGQSDQKRVQAEQGKAEEKDIAFQIADCYISIQETEGGYNYSIMNMDYKEIESGVYEKTSVDIQEIADDIVDDLRVDPFDNGVKGSIGDDDKMIPIDYDRLMENTLRNLWRNYLI